nr:MBL fold metallo-hydrolase [Halococcus salsus]
MKDRRHQIRSDTFDSRPSLFEFQKAKTYDEPVAITFLGTAGERPTDDRITSSILLKRGNEQFLFDVGEGTQQRLTSHCSNIDIDAIFLTSVAIDHTGGLGPLLRRYTAEKRTRKLHVYTPVGTGERIESLIDAFGEFDYPIVVLEVSEGEVLSTGEYSIEAIETSSNDPSIGYVLKEMPHQGAFDEIHAKALGVLDKTLYRKLSKGEKVSLEGGREVDPRQVFGDPIAGRHIVYTGDTRPADTVVEGSQNADLLIHESAGPKRVAEQTHTIGHSTAVDAGRIAARAKAKKLVLTNFAPETETPSKEFSQAAKTAFDNEVEIAADRFKIELPPPASSTRSVEWPVEVSDEKVSFRQLEEGAYIQVKIDRVKESGLGLSKRGRVHIDDAEGHDSENVIVRITDKRSGYAKATIEAPPADETVRSLQIPTPKHRSSKSSSKKKTSHRKSKQRKSRPAIGRNPFRKRSGSNRSLVRKKL